MSIIDLEFKKLCKTILTYGVEYENKRRGVKRLQIPSYTFRHEFKDGFPALSLKHLPFKSVVGELLWFLRGDNDIKYLNDNGIKIWNDDAYNWHVKNGGDLTKEEFNERGTGSVGRNYSMQWTDFNNEVDQIASLMIDMDKDIMGSRLIVSAWNPSELDQTALPPCHTFFQIIGVPLENDQFGFELHWHQRSVDAFLGLPFNIGSYATMSKDLEDKTGYKAIAIQGDLKAVHFYENQYEAVKEMLLNNTNKHGNCELEISNGGKEIEDFKLIGYTSEKAIKVKMLAPLKI